MLESIPFFSVATRRGKRVRVLHISTSDDRAGASRAALRQHQALLACGIDSTMLVLKKSTADDASKIVELKTNRALHARLHRRLRWHELDADMRKHASTVQLNWETFSDDRSVYDADLKPYIAGYDVIVLHFTSGFLDWQSVFSTIARTNASVVFIPHDMNQFTGGCHYDMNCGRYSEHCGKCPQLASEDEKDFSYKILRRKKRALAMVEPAKVRILPPTQWMQDLCRASSLLRPYTSDIVHLGVETEVFRPVPKQSCREILNIPQNAVVLATAAQALDNRRKGVDLLFDAVRKLENKSQLFLLTMGAGTLVAPEGIQSCHVGYLENDQALADALNCADMFILPSLQENSAQTALEAMSCGVPVVAFSTGGSTDFVQPGQTGALAKLGDTDSLAQELQALLLDGDLRIRLGTNSRNLIESEYNLSVQAGKYAEIYQQLADRCVI